MPFEVTLKIDLKKKGPKIKKSRCKSLQSVPNHVWDVFYAIESEALNG